MNIYFTASVTAGRQYLDQYKTIVSEIKKLGHSILSEDVAYDSYSEKDNRLASDKTLSSEEIYQKEIKEIETSDIVVAEVSQPSTGVGILISHSLQIGKTVLAMVYGDNENKISPFIENHPSHRLYLEHYTEDNLHIKLEKFLAFCITTKQRKGKLIVIDGGDGVGKKTQVDLLLTYLKDHNYPSKYIDFPRYYSSFQGQMVARYLSGEFGDVHEVSPYLSSLAYALDRLSAREEIEQWLLEGNLVVANRYVSTSMAYQTAKLSQDKRLEFMDWLYELEYKQHKMPKEDIVIYLSVPVNISQKLIDQRSDKRYLKDSKRDIHEQNIGYLKDVESVYLQLVTQNKKWVNIDCINNEGFLLSKQEIHRKIISILKKHELLIKNSDQ